MAAYVPAAPPPMIQTSRLITSQSLHEEELMALEGPMLKHVPRTKRSKEILENVENIIFNCRMDLFSKCLYAVGGHSDLSIPADWLENEIFGDPK